MKIAIPVSGGRLSPHFGRCESFALIEADPGTKQIQGQQLVASPPHERGAFPAMLAQHGVTHLLVSGIGWRALELFRQHGIEVVTGAPPDAPEDVVRAFLDGTLESGECPCDHDERHGCSGHEG